MSNKKIGHKPTSSLPNPGINKKPEACLSVLLPSKDAGSHLPLTPYGTISSFLKKENGLFQFLEKLPVGITLISPKTLDTIFANRICLDILGYTALKKKPAPCWKNLLLPASYKRFMRLITQPGNRNFFPSVHHLQIKRIDGNIRDIRVSLSDLVKQNGDCSLLFVEDITKQVKHEKALYGNLKNLLDAFSYRIIEVQEDERRKISRDLHDEIGQNLTAIKFMVKTLVPPSDNSSPADRNSEDLINTTIAQIQKFAVDLNPVSIITRGLLHTLKEYFERYQVWSGITVKFTHAGLEDRAFPLAVSNTVYRIIQESLTNVARHASSKDVEVDIYVNRQNCIIRITDKGKGFNPKTLVIRQSGGIKGIFERLLLLRGELDIDSSPGKGTCLTARIPLSNNMGTKGSKNDIYRSGRRP